MLVAFMRQCVAFSMRTVTDCEMCLCIPETHIYCLFKEILGQKGYHIDFGKMGHLVSVTMTRIQGVLFPRAEVNGWLFL
jgi:hypothetical protein